MIDKSVNIKGEEKSSKFKKIFKIIVIIIFILLLTILYSRFIGTKGLIVKETKIINENFVEEFYGLKIIHISDLHYGSTINKNDLKKIVDKINALKPDIVVFTGDLYNGELKDDDREDLVNTLKNIKSNIKKYAISGNHDDENFEQIINDISFINLNNNIDLVYNTNNSSILFVGINTNDDIDESTEKVSNLLNFDDENSENEMETSIKYRILLLHEPDKIEKFDYSNYDLILAGHSHNGQIKLPFIGALYTPEGAKKYYDDFYDLGNTKLYISSGLGTSILKFRLFNHPSFNLYRLTNK